MNSWEQREGESPRVFQAFVVFRELGARRTLREAARKFYSPDDENAEVSPAQLKRFQRWSAEHQWVRRANEYDVYLAQEQTEARLKAIEQMNERQALFGTRLQYLAFERLQATDLKDLPTTEALRWLVEGSRIERLARGEATRRDEISGNGGGAITVSVDQVMAKLGRLATEYDEPTPEEQP